MTCEETQKACSPYMDGALTSSERPEVEAHLRACPTCRLSFDEARSLSRSLARLERPAPPPGLAASINNAIAVERAARALRPAHVPFTTRFALWLEPFLMPYGIGALASLILFVGVLAALRPHVGTLRELAAADRPVQSIIWVGGEGGYDVTLPITPQGFAAKRAGFAYESPSLDPQGALAALAWTQTRSGVADDDDMVVVADVYGNGRASLAAVVEPPRNRRAVSELEDALRKNPAFVPASLDGRPQTMRVIFVMQKMNVREASY